MSARLALWMALLAAPALLACAGDSETQVAVQRAPIVYGADGREELFEVADPSLRELVANSVVAVIPGESLVVNGAAVALHAPPRALREGLCPGEPFADQPAAALCSGVLVDWDLVLTAAHCARALRPGTSAIAFDYAYRTGGELALEADDLFGVLEVVAESYVEQDGRSSLDYAFVRLDRAVEPPHSPAPIRMSSVLAVAGAPLAAVGSGHGLPLKIDRGAQLWDPRAAAFDHFMAISDTAAGGSGGAAFDAAGALLGVLFRGGDDLIDTGDCHRENRVAESEPEEAYTYAQRALRELCAEAPEASSLCRSDCGDPCRALPPDAARASGCSLGSTATAGHAPVTLGWLALALACARYRRSARCRVPA